MGRRKTRPPPTGVYQLDSPKVCLLPRLSLSDLIVVNGLVRAVCERCPDVMLVAKRDHVASVRALYGDITSLRFKFVKSWAGHGAVADEVQARGYVLVPLPSYREACPYALVGLPSSMGPENFVLHRTLAAEAALHDKVVEAVGPVYVVVHHDDDRPIRSHLIPEGYPVVDVRDPRFRTESIFDWIRVIDHAVQLHAVDSCFLVLADVLNLRARKFHHAYASPTVGTARFKDAITIWG